MLAAMVDGHWTAEVVIQCTAPIRRCCQASHQVRPTSEQRSLTIVARRPLARKKSSSAQQRECNTVSECRRLGGKSFQRSMGLAWAFVPRSRCTAPKIATDGCLVKRGNTGVFSSDVAGVRGRLAAGRMRLEPYRERYLNPRTGGSGRCASDGRRSRQIHFLQRRNPMLRDTSRVRAGGDSAAVSATNPRLLHYRQLSTVRAETGAARTGLGMVAAVGRGV
jgi:hypothetical protein